jgi:hypothetical protein
MEPMILTAARGRVALRMTCVAMGEDLCVSLEGGEGPHVGAVALAVPRVPGAMKPGPPSTSVLARLGHREDGLARDVASLLATRLGVAVSVACGIHLDAPTGNELETAVDLALELAARAAAQLGGS